MSRIGDNMYSAADLDTLMSALNVLTADNFFQYDFNVGTVIPYLKISISQAQIASYPAIQLLPLTQPLIAVYYTLDFTPPVATFIANMQAACSAYAASSLPVWTAYYNHAVTFSGFLTTLASKE